MSANPKQWYQVIINDPNFLSGDSVREFVTPLIKIFHINFVLIKDVIGAVPSRSSFDGAVLSAADFMQRVALATQYDWAFFFMYEDNPLTNRKMQNGDDDRLLIEKADLTIRLVDSSQFFIYEKTGEILKTLKENPNFAESTVANLNELDIPY